MRVHVPPAALDGDRVEIRGGDLRHLRDVLRLRPGDRIELFDGAGRGFAATITRVSRSEAVVERLEPLAGDRESPLAITLAVALSKGAKLDWVVEKVTELGVRAIVPFVSARTVPDPTDFARRRQRLDRVAEAAAAQCGRLRCPTIEPLSPWTDLLGRIEDADLAVLFYEGAGDRLFVGDASGPGSLLLVTGPEGGFAASEVAEAGARGARVATLGPRILRAETAAIVAVSLAQHLRGDLGRVPR